MVLSDRDICWELEMKKALKIEPIGSLELQIQPCSVDLRLGNEFRIFPYYRKRTAFDPGPMIDPLEDDAASMMETMMLEDGDAFILTPGSFALACTIEKVTIPPDLLGRVDGRSSIGRLGILIHATAGLIDPGFSGILTLELGNIGPYPVILHPGMRICQISFERLSRPCDRPYGSRKGSKYQDQVGATASRIHRDPDGRKEL